MSGDHETDAVPEADRRAPVQAAGELARMGIDPAAVGLAADLVPPPPPAPPPPAPSPPPPGSPPAPPGSPPAPPGSPPAPPAPPPVPPVPPVPPAPPAPVADRPPAVPWLIPAAPAPVRSWSPEAPVSGQPGRSSAGRHAWPPAGPAPGILNRPLDPAQPDLLPPLDATARGDQLQQLLPENHGLVVPAGWRRLVRVVTAGLVAPGATAAMQHERLLVSRVRTRQNGPRMIAFVAGKGGVGTTTTAIGVWLTLARLRNDPAVLVDARSGTGSLGRRVADMPAPTTLDLAAGADPPTPPANRRGLHVVDAPPWHSPVDRARLIQLLEDLRQDFPLTALDVGNDLGEAAHAAFARADQVVVVTAASQDAVEATRVALARVQQIDPYRVASAVIGVVCLTARGRRAVARALRADLGLEASRIVGVPFDAGLVAGHRFDPERLRSSTREAYLRLAALVADPAPLTARNYLLPRQEPGR